MRPLRVAQHLDEVVRLGTVCSVDHLGVASIGAAIEDVVAHRAVQQRGVLRDHADLRAQAVLRHVGDVLAIDPDLAAAPHRESAAAG